MPPIMMTITILMIMMRITRKLKIMSKMRIMRCLITGTNASFFSQANAQGGDSDLTAMAPRKVFYGVWVEHFEAPRKVFFAVWVGRFEGPRKVCYAVLIRAKFS